MIKIDTYEDFLNCTVAEFHKFCSVKQPKDIVTKVFSFYNKAKNEGTPIFAESAIDSSITLKEYFGIN